MNARALLNFLGLRQNIVALLAMVVLVGMGEKMAERFLPIYLLALGGGVLSVGLLNGMNNLLSALYSFPGGYLSDRLGHKRALLIFNLIALFGYAIVIAFPYWQAVIIGAVFFLSWTAISLPATLSLVRVTLPKNKQTMGVAVHSLVRRLPMAVGPVVGGYLVTVFGDVLGIRIAFAIAFFLGIVSIGLQQTLIKEEETKETKTAQANPLKLLREMSRPLRNLLSSDILIRFAEQIPYAFVVVWCLKENSITPVQFGILTSIEMATAMLVYIPIAHLADRTHKKPFVLITFVNFSLFPLILYFSHSFGMLAIAFVVRGLKEFGEPSRKSLIMDLAPADNRAGMFGLYYLVRDLIVSIAAFGGAALWEISPEVNFFSAFACGILGAIYFAFFGSDLSLSPKQKDFPETA